MNKTFAVFANGGTMTTAQTALWQYDYGQILVVQGIELPTAYEVQFCNAGDSTTITSVGDSTGVVIPDQFLQNGETIYAYIYLHTGNADGETEYKITIPVMDRAEPTDIEPTPQQESTIGQLIDALNAGVEAAEEAAEKGPQIIDGYWHIWDAEAGEYVNTEVQAAGENGADGKDGNSIWRTDVEPTSETILGVTRRYYYYSNLSGATGREVQQGDLIVKSGDRIYYAALQLSDRCQVYSIGSIKGDPGEPGEDGYSPVVTITEIDGGHRVTITDEAHPDGQSFDVMDGQGGSGSSDYDDLSNKPQIAGVTLSGNKSLADLGIAAASDIPTVPSAYTSTPADLGTASAGSSTSWAKGDHVHKMPSAADVGAYALPSGGIPASDLASAVQTSLGKADAAIPAPVSPSSAQDLVYLNGAWVAADKVYIVNLTPIATDFSGTMDKTVAEIYAAYQAGKTIVFRAWASASEFADVTATMVGTNDNYNYPSFNAFIIMNSYNVIAYAYTSTTDNGSKATYQTIIYPISTSACIPAPATPTTGDFLCWNGSSWAATTVPSANGVSF